MSFLDTLRKDKMKAMKDKDKLTNAVVTSLMSAVSLAEKEKGEPLTEAEALAFVQKEIKQNEDTIESLPEDRVDNIGEAKDRIEILRAYLPAQLSEEDLVKEIEALIEDLGLEKSPKSLGKIIPRVLEKFPGQTDGKAVSEAAKKLLV